MRYHGVDGNMDIEGYEKMSRKTTISSMPRIREWVTYAIQMNVNANVRGNIFEQ
jgi:hypothetical protein